MARNPLAPPAVLAGATVTGLALIGANVGIWALATFESSRSSREALLTLFVVVAVAQLVSGMIGVVAGFRRRKVGDGGLADILIGSLVSVGALVGGYLGAFGLDLASGGV